MSGIKIYDYNGRKNISGQRIRECRRKAGMTQTELAAQLQLSGITLENNCISRIESGARFVADYELLVLSDIFGVSLAYLVGRE